MSYLSSATSKLEYGVVQVGGNINVTDGVISVPQSLETNASVTFANIAVTGNLSLNGASVITSITPVAGNAGITLCNVITSGPAAGFTIYNTGVTSLTAGAGISITGNTGDIVISSYGADLINVYGTTTSYTASITDEYIGVYSAGAVTITLPNGIAGRVYTIKDEYGQGSGKITISPQIGELIDGKPTYVIGVPFQAVSVVFRAGSWRII
jgi:hypothetical protein